MPPGIRGGEGPDAGGWRGHVGGNECGRGGDGMGSRQVVEPTDGRSELLDVPAGPAMDLSADLVEVGGVRGGEFPARVVTGAKLVIVLDRTKSMAGQRHVRQAAEEVEAHSHLDVLGREDFVAQGFRPRGGGPERVRGVHDLFGVAEHGVERWIAREAVELGREFVRQPFVVRVPET